MKSCCWLLRSFLFVLVLILLVGCSSPQQSKEITLVYDGKTCQYQGPNVVEEGDVTITLKNKSEYQPSVWIVRMDEGKSWQDMLDFIGPPGSNVHPPSWTSTGFLISAVPNNPDAEVYTLKPGLYAICCCTCYDPFNPKGVWPGAALEVKSP